MGESDAFADDLFAVAVSKSKVHGAMGFTHEHALHFTTRRLWAWSDEVARKAIGRNGSAEMSAREVARRRGPRLLGIAERELRRGIASARLLTQDLTTR
jgi:hypothetical protein